MTHSDVSKNTPAAVMTLGTQKVFDSVEWPYLFGTLRMFRSGKISVGVIEIICCSPKSSVITNNT